MAGSRRLLALRAAVAGLLVATVAVPCGSRRPPAPRCGPPCSCWRESALCVGAAGAPRSLPAGLGSLSLVNGTFSEVKDRMFSHLPSLQLLLLNSNSFTVIRDDAFAGLFHLEYLSPFFLLKMY